MSVQDWPAVDDAALQRSYAIVLRMVRQTMAAHALAALYGAAELQQRWRARAEQALDDAERIEEELLRRAAKPEDQPS